jgi:hypothetical protein
LEAQADESGTLIEGELPTSNFQRSTSSGEGVVEPRVTGKPVR